MATLSPQLLSFVEKEIEEPPGEKLPRSFSFHCALVFVELKEGVNEIDQLVALDSGKLTLTECGVVPPVVPATVASPLVTASLSSSEPETTASLPAAELEFAKVWETEVSAEATPLTEKEKARQSTAKSSTKTVAFKQVLKNLPLDEYPVKFLLIIPPL